MREIDLRSCLPPSRGPVEGVVLPAKRWTFVGHRVRQLAWPVGIVALGVGAATVLQAVNRGRGSTLVVVLGLTCLFAVAVLVGYRRTEKAAEARAVGIGQTHVVSGGISRAGFSAVTGASAEWPGPVVGTVHVVLDPSRGLLTKAVANGTDIVHEGEVTQLELACTRSGRIVRATLHTVDGPTELIWPRGSVATRS